MDQYKKGLLRQLQIAGIGLIILIFGLIKDQIEFCLVGAFVFILGILRYMLIKKMIDKL